MISLLLASSLAADPEVLPTPRSAPLPEAHLTPSRKVRTARQLEAAGKFFTGLGIVAGGAAAGMGFSTLPNGDFGLGVSAVIVGGAGLGCVLIGTPMWAVGAARERYAVELSVAPIVGPQGGGFALGGRF